MVIEEKDLTINRISSLITELIDNSKMLLEMSEKSYRAASKNAAEKMLKKVFN